MLNSNMKRSKYIITLLICSIAFVACEDLIEVDVPNGTTKIVVDALLYESDSSHVITLTTTAPYFDKNSTPRVTGASVFLLTDKGDSIAFLEKSFGTGNYFADFKIADSTLYFLNIISPSGRIYRSHSEKLLRVPPLEVYQSDKFLDSLGDFRAAGYYVSIRTQEPAGQGDFYRWIIHINGEKQIGPDLLWVADDLLVDGNVIEEFPQFFIYGMLPGDSVEIWQTSISDRAYHYWLLVQEQVFNQGSPFDTPPSSIEGNVQSLSDPNEFVLGLFSISNLESDQLTVKAK